LTLPISADAFDKLDLIAAVDFAELDFNNFAAAGGNVFSDIGCLNGQLAMTAVDEDGELYAARASMVKEGVKRGADGAAGVEDVVTDDDVAALDVKANGAGVTSGRTPAVDRSSR